jgi:hypothetical protein
MTILLGCLMAVLSIALVWETHRVLAGVRVTRRVAWEVDRAEWRRWISRP